MDWLFSWPTIIAAIGALAAVAWFVPPLRKPALAALGVLIVAVGIRKSGERAGAQSKQKEWNDAERNMAEKVRDASARAHRTVADSPDGVRGSPYDRDDRD